MAVEEVVVETIVVGGKVGGRGGKGSMISFSKTH